MTERRIGPIVMETIEHLIGRIDWRPATALETCLELGRELGVSESTVHRALTWLRRNGALANRGSGHRLIVAGDPIAALQRLVTDGILVCGGDERPLRFRR